MIGRVKLPDGTEVPALGQGTWKMGERAQNRAAEVAALQLGVDLGMTLIDTAEMYADGEAETVVAEAIAGRRETAFVVSKVYPQNAGGARLVAACERSLQRLRIDTIDLYLLHWRGATRLADTVAGLVALRQAGKIRHWGVSNLDADELQEIVDAPGGLDCATDQVLYNLQARGPEFDLLPWCDAHQMPVMAYSPVGQGMSAGGALLRHPALRRVAERHGASAAQIALAWTLRRPGVVSIPKASDAAHVRENAAAAEIVLSPEDHAELDAAFPPPRGKRALAML